MHPSRDSFGDYCVIWISEEEADAEPTGENAVVMVRPATAGLGQEEQGPEEAMAEEVGLVMTFYRRGHVMPHAQYDCPTCPLQHTENQTSVPVGQNAKMCGQCYCCVCDELTSECPSWTSAQSCHCKSKHWKDERNRTLAGILVTFNLELTEIDVDLQCGGKHLLLLTQELAMACTRYLTGERLPGSWVRWTCHSGPSVGQCCVCQGQHQNTEPVYRYSEIFSLVSSFINQAEKETPKTSAVMLLGAIRETALHKGPALQAQGSCQVWELKMSHATHKGDLHGSPRRHRDNMGTTESPKRVVPLLMSRMMQLLQRMLVLGNLPQPLCQKFACFFQAVPLPPYCFAFTSCLNVALWDHRLLTTVLKGQSITGPQRRGGKKFLWEAFAVRARVEQLESLSQYREIVRYLKAVKCEDTVRLCDLRDKASTCASMGTSQVLPACCCLPSTRWPAAPPAASHLPTLRPT